MKYSQLLFRIVLASLLTVMLTGYAFSGGGGSSGGKGGGGTPPAPTYTTVQLSVTYYVQETTYYCGMACMQMYLDYLFRKKGYMWDSWNNVRVPSQLSIWGQTTGGYWDNYPTALNFYLPFAGYASSYTKKYTYPQYGYTQLDSQKNFINNNEVCVTGFGQMGYGSDHAILMYGYEILSGSSSSSDIKTILYHYPWVGADQKATLSQWDSYTLVN